MQYTISKDYTGETIVGRYDEQTNYCMEKQVPDFVRENDYFSVYSSEKMTIFITRRPCPVLKGEFSHRSYEFVILLSPVLGFVVDRAVISMPEDALLPVNSNQVHGRRLTYRL